MIATNAAKMTMAADFTLRRETRKTRPVGAGIGTISYLGTLGPVCFSAAALLLDSSSTEIYLNAYTIFVDLHPHRLRISHTPT